MKKLFHVLNRSILPILPLVLALLVFSVDASAQQNAASALSGNTGGFLFDKILYKFSNGQSGAGAWGTVMTAAASWLFWTLATISLVWTGGVMALRKADIGEFFAEFVRFIMFTGFFWWLLLNGPEMAMSIFHGLMDLAGTASNMAPGAAMTPDTIVDIGFELLNRTFTDVDRLNLGVSDVVFHPTRTANALVDALVGLIMAVCILILFAVIAINAFLLLASVWILSYAGIIFLGFGGSRWTSDMALNYYRTVLGAAAQLMTMVFLVGIGKQFMEELYNAVPTGRMIDILDMGVLMVTAVTILLLTSKVPGMVAGIVGGGSSGGITPMGLVTKAAAVAAAATGVGLAAAGAIAAAGDKMEKAIGAGEGDGGGGGKKEE